MFVVYVNDLPRVVDTGSVHGYADNFKVITQTLKDANNFASEFEKRRKDNHMNLNLGKSKIQCSKGIILFNPMLTVKSKL